MLKNKLIVIGCTGSMIAYLNVSIEEATKRYKESKQEEEIPEDWLQEFEFNDSFGCYDAWKTED